MTAEDYKYVCMCEGVCMCAYTHMIFLNPVCISVFGGHHGNTERGDILSPRSAEAWPPHAGNLTHSSSQSFPSYSPQPAKIHLFSTLNIYHSTVLMDLYFVEY